MADDSGWFVRNRGRILGPFAFAQLEVMRNRGQLAKFHELSQDRRTWVQADSFPALFPAASAPQPAAEPGPVATAGGEIPVDATYVSAGPDPAGAIASDREDGQLWYYAHDQTQIGPHPIAELIRLARNGEIGPDTFVRNLAMPDWVPARTVAALALGPGTSSREFPTLDPGSGGGGQAGPGASALGVAPLSGMALAGFVLGIGGLLAGFLTIVTYSILAGATGQATTGAVIFLILLTSWVAAGAIGIILSAVGLIRTGRSPEIWRGYGMALTGFILGIVSLIGLLVCIVIGLIAAFAKT